MTLFRLGLIGAGRMGRTHLAALDGAAGLDVVAIAEPAQAIRESLKGAGVPLYAGVEDMLETARLDGVIIAVPSDQHLAVVRAVAAAGIPMLCEKPCGVAPGQAQEAAGLARAAGVPLQVAYWRRYVPQLQALHARIREGALGEIYFIACYQWDEAPPSPAFRAKSGGIFIDMGVHEFDQLRWLSGQDIAAVQAVPAHVTSDAAVPGDVESAAVLCRLGGGATALVSLGRRYPAGDMCKVEVFGTRGAESIEFLTPTDGVRAFHGALCLQAQGFAAWVRGGAMHGARAEDATAALSAAVIASRSLALPG